MLVSKLDVDDVISWLGGAVCDLARAVLLVLCVDVHFAGTFDGQAQAAVTYGGSNTGEDAVHLEGAERETRRRDTAPASRVSMINSAGSNVLASLRP